MPDQGDKAPDVTLQMADGSTRTLADFQGRPLVLYFYPKDDTSGCTAEAQSFTDLAAEFAAAGAAVVGVSKDSAARHQKFIAKYDLKVDLATDADDSVCAAFGTWVEKSMYGRKYMGIERATFLIGADGRIVRVWRKVKVPGHAAEVLKAVQAPA
ncbi:alkyl hydroperoxide reductase [Sphingomonas sp. MM-1]|uniref:peroxiredoxin n=1 Tax=Sphingomonas sp. MM-1 TaxID=745310 RepID=UPI0002C0B6ED|nr:peroxiredoxin [Sphingomonas sp. MM-1]AGH48969.1 alkyl hydroperoxide reductase [Sphingomonas sp. MM-1]